MPSSGQSIDESSVEHLLRSIENQTPAAGSVREFIGKADQFWNDDQQPSAQERLPRQLGRFRLLELLGEGGFGLVYLAEETLSGKKVALKLPRPERLIRPEWRERFLREARAAAVLTHANIVRVYDAGEIDGQWYISNYYCPGPNLAQWLTANHRSVEVAEAAQLLCTLAGAMAHAHERGVIHRDLKPSNILLEPKEGSVSLSLADVTPCIADFGLAKLIEESEAQTVSGVLLGTLQYMAPEQAGMKRQEVGPATDIYALGLILYEVLTRKPVVPAEPVLLSLPKIMFDTAPRLRSARPDCPADLETIYLKCLEKNPRQRYASAQALHDDLNRFLQGQSIVARPVSMARRLGNWVKKEPVFATILLFSLLTMMLVLGGVVFHAHQTEQSNQRIRAALHRTQQLHYLSTIQRAAQLVQSGEGAEASQLLRRCREELEEQEVPLTWEWRYLWNRIECMPRHYRWLEHRETPYCLSYSLSRNCLATSDGLGISIIRDATTGQIIKTIHEDIQGYTPLIFSPDGNWLAQYVGKAEHPLIRVWDTHTWTIRNSIKLLSEAFGDFRFHPTLPRTLLIGTQCEDFETDQGRLYTWNFLETNEPMKERFSGCHTQKLLWCEARHLWIVIGAAKILALDEQFQAKPLLNGTPSFIKGTATSPDGKYFAWATLNGRIQLFEWKDNQLKLIRFRNAHPAAINQLDFSPDSTVLVSSGSGRQVQFWSVPSLVFKQRLETKGDTSGVTFAPDGQSVFFGTAEDFAVHRWYHADYSGRNVSATLGDQIWSAALTNDGNQLILGLDDDHSPDTIRHLELKQPGLPASKTSSVHQATVTGMILLEGSQQIISSSIEGKLILHDRKTGTIQAKADAHEKGGIRCLTDLGDGRFATSGQDGLIQLWNHQLQRIGTPLMGHDGFSVCGMVYDSETQQLYSCGGQSIVQWDITTPQLVKSFETVNEVRAVSLSYDGKYLAYGTKQGDIYLVSLKDWKVLQHYRGHDDPITRILFTPDSRSLISGDFAGRLNLWHVESGQQLLKLPAHQDRITELLWNKEGSKLYSTSLDGRVVEHDFR